MHPYNPAWRSLELMRENAGASNIYVYNAWISDGISLFCCVLLASELGTESHSNLL